MGAGCGDLYLGPKHVCVHGGRSLFRGGAIFQGEAGWGNDLHGLDAMVMPLMFAQEQP